MVLRYHSGKGTISKPIASAILSVMDRGDGARRTRYAEPFSGMFRVGIQLLSDKRFFRRMHSIWLNDQNADVFCFWDCLVHQGWLPRTTPLTPTQYTRWKNKARPSAQRTFYGLSLSLRGTMYDVRNPNAPYNTVSRMRATRKRMENLQQRLNEKQVHVSRWKVNGQNDRLHFSNTVVYCDPPYVGHVNGSWSENCEKQFWGETMVRWTNPRLNNLVFLSTTQRPAVVRKRIRGGGASLTAELLWTRYMPNRTSGSGMGRVEHLYRVGCA